MPITVKTEKFTVESYEVSVSQATDGLRRTVSLTSPDLSHGIRFNAVILFFKTNFAQPSVGHANNLAGANFDPRSLTLWGDNTLFDGLYAVLSTEAPLTFEFTYEVDSALPNEDQKDVTSYRLFSGRGTPGDFEKPTRLSVLTNLQPALTGDSQ
ncbi:hypothetical protein [Spirosoma rhododendri]|uniref:Uncharacterized protein n=1 Tax=Spirosoma rhododendri TaxID=2728024 RepID=A0A7L5DRC6_9BACT|nr:hypothetical protein [Spirosoma rhododendri]QJD79773.1 hypothetical protein HH216_16110 [Spirosoma rhododendri]